MQPVRFKLVAFNVCVRNIRANEPVRFGLADVPRSISVPQKFALLE